MASLGTLVTNFTANTAGLVAGVARASSLVRSFVSSVSSGATSAGSSIASTIGPAMGGAATIVAGAGATIIKWLWDIGKTAVKVGAIAAAAFVAWGTSLAMSAEQLQIQFDVLTGQGQKVFRDIENFALKTAFSLDSAGEAARGLLASGVNERQLVGTMRLLGDLAMGDGERMKLLSKAYTDVLSKQKLQAQELRQFSENGVGLVSELGKMFNKTSGEILKMSEQGQIGFEDMQRALMRLTGEGGRFNGMMDRMAQTTSGRFETLKENVAIMARTVAQQFLPALNDVLKKVNDFLDLITGSENRWQTMKDVFLAAWNLALTTAKFKWTEWAADLGKILWEGIKSGMNALNPAKLAFQAGVGLGNIDNGQAFKDMEAAQVQFNHVMGVLQQNAKNNVQQMPGLMQGALPTDVKGTKAALTQFAQLNKAQRIAMFGGQQAAIDHQQALREQLKKLKQEEAMKDLGGVLENLVGKGQQVAFGAQQFGVGLMQKGQFWLNTAKNAFDGTWQRKGQDRQDKFGAAMLRGSAEAYSAIVNQQRTGKDPTTMAVKEQTGKVVGKLDELLKKNPLAIKVVEAFAI